jgi:hypothetical protein
LVVSRVPPRPSRVIHRTRLWAITLNAN